MTNLTPPEAAYAVYRKRFSTAGLPGSDTPWEDLSKGARGFWAEVAEAAIRAALSRDTIVATLATKFGPHKAYDRAAKDYLPDGNDAEGSCFISEPHEYEDIWHVCGLMGDCNCRPVKRTATQMRALTYGEVADALASLNGGKP